MSKPYIEITSIGELCKALGIPKSNANKIEIRRDLVIGIRNKIKERNLTHENAAILAKVGRTVITSIVNGNIGKISTDKLIDVANSLGIHLHLQVA